MLEDRQEVAVWREGTGREPRCRRRGQAGSPGAEIGGREGAQVQREGAGRDRCTHSKSKERGLRGLTGVGSDGRGDTVGSRVERPGPGPRATKQRVLSTAAGDGGELPAVPPQGWGPGLSSRLTEQLRRLVSPWERAASSTTAALTSSKKLGTCVASARPSRATRSW